MATRSADRAVTCRHAPGHGGWWYVNYGARRHGRCWHCGQRIVKDSTGDGWTDWRVDTCPAGRSLAQRGELHWKARFSRRDIAEIRAVYAAGGASQYQLARRYGTSRGNISNIVRGRAWRAA